MIGRVEFKLKPLLALERWAADVPIKREGLFDETGSLKTIGSVRVQVRHPLPTDGCCCYRICSGAGGKGAPSCTPRGH